MKLLKLFSLLCMSLLVLSTKCNKHKTPGTVRGRIMLNCTTPLPNHVISMRTNLGGGASFVEDANGNTEFKTDSDGYFEINYVTRGWEGSIVVNGYSDVLEMIPIGEGMLTDVGEVNLNGKFNYIVKLQVNNPHTMYDTLVYGDLENLVEIRIPGPFQSGIIDTFNNIQYIKYPMIYNKTPLQHLNYALYPYVSGTSKTINIGVSFCSNSYSMATFVID